MSLIVLDQVHKCFGAREVLKGVSLEVAAGEVVAIIGRSGSGKSTLLRCINGLETVDAGTVRFDGQVVGRGEASLRALRLAAGIVFQQFNLFPHLSVGRNVMLAQTVVKGTAAREAGALARRTLDRVGLGSKFDAYPDQLSGGEQQRVAIARALAMEPRALLCDEITSALDPELVNEVLAVVRALAADGMTLVLVTHEMRFAREVCDRVVFLHGGTVWESGRPEEVFGGPRTPELRQFLGVLARA